MYNTRILTANNYEKLRSLYEDFKTEQKQNITLN